MEAAADWGVSGVLEPLTLIFQVGTSPQRPEGRVTVVHVEVDGGAGLVTSAKCVSGEWDLGLSRGCFHLPGTTECDARQCSEKGVPFAQSQEPGTAEAG